MGTRKNLNEDNKVVGIDEAKVIIMCKEDSNIFLFLFNNVSSVLVTNRRKIINCLK